MKSVSLAAKLGLKVGLLSAMLLFLFACLGYRMLGQALENSAREDLDVKMAGLAHNLAAIDSAAGIDAGTHHLVDLVLGHDNLHVSNFQEDAAEPLLVIGSRAWAWPSCSRSWGCIADRRWSRPPAMTSPGSTCASRTVRRCEDVDIVICASPWR